MAVKKRAKKNISLIRNSRPEHTTNSNEHRSHKIYFPI